MRGLSRLLRRNPTEAERALWQALVNDRRFAGRGFKRQTPIGQHICDFVSFPLRLVIDLVPAEESARRAKRVPTRLAWLEEREYRVSFPAAMIEIDLPGALARIAAAGDCLDRIERALSPYMSGLDVGAAQGKSCNGLTLQRATARCRSSCTGPAPFMIAAWLLGQFGDDLPKGLRRVAACSST